MAAMCQPFQEANQQQEQNYLPLHHHGGSVLPSLYRGSALQQQQQQQPGSAPSPATRQLSSASSSGTRRSATEARALKIHCEAERRRRERINAHLATLRRMIPDARQMDKATLLSRVVRQLKDLKRKSSEAAQPPLPIPAEANGVTVDCYAGAVTGDGRPATARTIRASVSSDDRPGLLADLAGALRGLRLRPLRADVASLGGRARCELVLCREDGGDVAAGAGRANGLEEAVRRALATAAFPEAVDGCGGGGGYRSRRQRVLESQYHLCYR